MSKRISNTKEVRRIMEEHIISAYEDKKALIDTAKGLNHECFSWFQAGVKMAKDGCFLVYYGQAREFLQELFKQTKEQADKYTDEKVWNTYCNMCGMALERVAKGIDYPVDYKRLWGRK